jgi:fibronectin-binding autotransporter adhesin
VTLTFALASQEFINSVGVQVGGNAYNYSGFDHTADNSSVVYRSGDTSSRVMYRKLTLPTSQFVAGNNTLTFHIVGGEMQWDALRLDIQNPGTWSQSQWNGGTGNWTDGTQWLTQKSNYTAVLKGTASNVYSTSTTFADGASATAPVNSAATTNYYDATLNGGTVTLNTSVGVQKLSLLAGTISAGAGTPTLTANDAVVLGGGTLTGKARLNALSTTTVTFDNTISAGFTVTSTGTVTVVDGSSVTVTGAGSRWDTTGVSLGSGSSLSVGAGGTFNAGTGTLNLSSGATASSVVGGAVVAGSVVSAGSLNLAGTLVLGTGGALTNSGTAVISGVISGSAQVVNTRGLLVLSGTNSYLSGTTITGGTVQFASLVAIGGSGANVTVGYGGAVAFGGGVTNAGFLARLAPGAKGALALLPGDSATNLDFTSGALASVNQMSVGAAAGSTVTFTGTITPAGGTYRLGGGGGAIVLGNPISGSASLVVGNTGSDGVVRLPGASNYAGTTTVRGGSLQLTVLAAGGLPSSLGASSNAASNLVLDGGTVSYVGSGSQSTDRLMTVRGSVAFDSSGSGSASWSNTGAVNMLWPGNRTVLLGGTSTGSNVFAPTLADPLVGATSLTKTGTGTWTLGSGTSTYSGDTAILGGTLKLGGSANLPSGAGKGNLSVGTSATLDLSGSAASINGLNDGPAPASGWASPNGPGGGTITNSGPSLRTLTIGNGDAGGLYSGIIAGNVSLVKTGAGTQILSGDNSYLGTTTISGGTLQVGVGGTPSSTGPGDGGFRGMLGAGAVINNATLTFNRGYYTTVSNVISGTGTLKQVANAQLVLAGLNTYTGPTVIGGGIANIGLGGPTDYTGLAYSGDSSINASVLANGGVASSIGASSNAASNLVLNGGTLFYSSTSAVSTDRLFTVTAAGGAIYTSGALTFTNTGALGMTGTGDRVLSLGGDSTSASTVSAAISDPAGGGKTGLTKDRSATWILTSPSHSYSGDTTLLMGTLKIGTGGKLPFGPGKGNIVFGTSTDFSSVYPAILDLNGNDLSVNAISGGNLGTGYWSVTNSGASLKTLTLGNGDATGDFNGDIEGNINVVKTGLGTQTLDGTNSYAGSTTINGGALILGPTATIGGTGRSITIASGATLGVPASVMSQSFLGRIATNGATGTLALTSSETNSLDFSATGANLSAISLGAGVGTNVTMSGLITPFGAMYRLGGGGGALTVSSNLTGASSSVVVSGAGTVVLSGTNTYGGPVTVGSGSTLQFGTTASLAGGTGANITVSAGGCVAVGYALDLAFLGRVASTSAGVVALGANSANNLSFATPGLANVSLGATAAVTYSGLLTPSGTTYRLGGGGGTLTVSAVNALTGANSLVVSGPGTVVVSAANNFTGTVTINSGATLQASVANGGTASGLGISSNAASNLVLAGGTLRVVGSTDRSFTLSSNSTLDCGSGTTGIGFGSSTGVVSMPASANLTLTLTGSNSGHNTLSLQLPNPSGGTLSIIKTGTGKWTFSGGAKTYSGTTQVLAGQLETLATNALSANSNLFIDSGASLEMHDFSQTILSLSGSGNIYNTFSTNKTLTLGGTNGSGTYTGIITAPITVTKTGTGTQYFGGNNTYAQTTTISGGILGLGIPGSNSTSGSLGTGPVVNNARLALYRSDNYTLPNNISGSGVLEQAGSGQTTLTGSITYTGNTSVTGSGSLIFASVFKPVTSSLVVSGVGGDAIFNGTGVAAQFAGITVAAGGTVALGLSDRPTVSPRVLVTNSLSIAAGGTLDLGNGDMIIKGGASNLAALRSYVASGALIASASQTNSPEYTPYTTLAIFANDASGQPYFTSYDGVTGLANTDVIVKYTYLGDTNLDGVLDGKDYRRIMEGAITGQTGWNWGDLDYSGGPVSTADLTEFLAVYDWYQAQSSVTNLGNGQDGGSAVVAIPEPGRSLPAAAILTTLLTRGRRRRR